MFKSIFKLICFIGILAISKSTFSQTTTITYIGQSGIPTASCNVFNPAINVNGVFHSSYAGGVLCDTTNGISLSTTPLSSPKGGTAFVIHYNFIPGNLYAISITAKGNTSLSLNTSVIPNANQFPTNGNLCPPDPNTSSYSTAGYGQMTAKLTNASTGYNIPQFSITGNNVYPYLIIWASGGINNQYIDALSISRIVIENIPIISASATSISCGATTPITFTVSNGATGITGYTWNLGANNGWQYNGSDASPTITTAVNTLTLTPTCGMALSSISATVNTNTGNYNSTTSTITVTQPTINMSIASASGNYSVCNTDNYSITNLPCNASVAWDVSPTGITIPGSLSGPTTSLTNNGISGNLTLTANVNSCGLAYAPITQAVHIGGYQSSDYTLVNNTTNSMYYCVGKTINFSVSGPAGTTGYIWSTPGWQTVYGGNGNSYATIVPTTTPTGTVSASFTEPCGTAISKNMFMAYSNYVCVNNDPRYGSSPNPAPTSLNVYVNSAYLTNTFIKQIQLVQINTGSTIYTQNYSSGYVQNTSIYMGSYPSGPYTLRIYDGAVWATYIVLH